MNYALKITNTWTKKESLYPSILSKKEAEAKKIEIESRSRTQGHSNNMVELIELNCKK